MTSPTPIPVGHLPSAQATVTVANYTQTTGVSKDSQQAEFKQGFVFKLGKDWKTQTLAIKVDDTEKSKNIHLFRDLKVLINFQVFPVLVGSLGKCLTWWEWILSGRLLLWIQRLLPRLLQCPRPSDFRAFQQTKDREIRGFVDQDFKVNEGFKVCLSIKVHQSLYSFCKNCQFGACFACTGFSVLK